ncbi:MAG: creatininase family protein [Egibacteraceae bacterium]
MRVEHMTWPEYRDSIATRIVVLPIGAIDGHGPHLPLSTDTIIAAHLAHALESHLDVLVLPAVPYSQKTDPTASGGEFPGVTHLRASTLTNVVLDLLRASYRHGARRFLILDSHKANAGSVRESADLFIDGAPGTRIMAAAWWDLVSEDSRNAIAAETGVGRHDDHHAAMVETSLIMHVSPEMVRRDLVGDDSVSRRARYLIRPVPDELRTRGGVVYRASRASAAIGERLLAEIVANLVEAVKRELT